MGGDESAKGELHNQKYKCFLATETFEHRECMGQVDESLKDQDTYFDMAIGKWISISK